MPAALDNPHRDGTNPITKPSIHDPNPKPNKTQRSLHQQVQTYKSRPMINNNLETRQSRYTQNVQYPQGTKHANKCRAKWWCKPVT